jgi:hypothetical protein
MATTMQIIGYIKARRETCLFLFPLIPAPTGTNCHDRELGGGGHFYL